MTSEVPSSFSGINYMICAYCKHIAIGPTRDGWNEGCGLRLTPQNNYFNFGDDLNPFFGCDKFESSGLPTHPSIVDILVERNSLASTIPVDENATEGSYDFSNKRDTYPHIACNEYLVPLKEQ